ncbi:MAG: UDP-N-acetylmuramoyl-tripeptide--D-alanyl-D-alanine ligase, partial [Acidobacteria bacterium]|nr:UDP-N-acetylmuramoyl-tripeptide--D-alanyl-D-alanine ligase [Acidobacteriota bacterium]
YADRFAGRVISFGTSDNADVRAVDIIDDGLDGMQARVTTPRGLVHLRVPLPGLANLSNVLCATAVATEMGVPLDAIAERAARLRPARRRGEVRVLDNGVTVIDDSYNSSPAALTRALETLSHERRASRRVAVLGEMLELGERSQSLHETCGQAVARAGVDLLITAGGASARALGDAAVRAGLDPARVHHVDTSTDAAALAAASVRAGDVVLVKGSRGIRMDVVVDRLVEGHG